MIYPGFGQVDAPAIPQDLLNEATLMSEKLTSKGFLVIYGGVKGHGFWIKDTINPRMKTNWWSIKECESLI